MLVLASDGDVIPAGKIEELGEVGSHPCVVLDGVNLFRDGARTKDALAKGVLRRDRREGL